MSTRRDYINFQRRILSATVTGDLLDVTDEAHMLGFSWPVAISKRLFTCIVRPFLAAQQSDLVPLKDILCSARDSLNKGRGYSPAARHAGCKWSWNGQEHVFSFRVRIEYCDKRIAGLVITASNEVYRREQFLSDDSLPAALLLRLCRLLKQIRIVSRSGDGELLNEMHQTVCKLIRPSPLAPILMNEMQQEANLIEPSFTNEQYRNLLLTSIGDLIAYLRACPCQQFANLIGQLSCYWLAMTSAASELLDIIEALTKTTGQVLVAGRRREDQPFYKLLDCYFQVRSRLSKGHMTVPSNVLICVRRYLEEMSMEHNGSCRNTVEHLRHRFERIDRPTTPGRLIELNRSVADQIIWH